MKAVTWHGLGDIRLDTVRDPRIQDPLDAILRVTTAAICGTDLHFIRGTMTGMKKGTVLGHEAVGVIEDVGKGVRNLTAGTRVVVGSTVSCGYCPFCKAGSYSQCDNANPNGRNAGTAFFGGPEAAGPIDGFQAEYARVPFANVIAVPLPDSVTDAQAVMLSDIFPTAWFGGRLAEIRPGDTVAVFGLGPVGQFAVLSAYLQGAGRVFGVDTLPSRLLAARRLGAETIDFNADDPVSVLHELTGGSGPDCVIDAVGVEAQRPTHGPAGKQAKKQSDELDAAYDEVVDQSGQHGELWKPGDAPTQVAQWAVESVAKAGRIAVIGVYPPQLRTFPFGEAFNKNLTIRTGNCPHRRYIPELVRLTASGVVDPAAVLTQQVELADAIAAYESFDRRDEGWIKTALHTS